MASPRKPRPSEHNPVMHKILCDTVASVDKTRQQQAADNALIAAMRAPVMDVDKVQAALQAGANADRIIVAGTPALHMAIEHKDLAVLQLLLKFDADVSDVDAKGLSVLDKAYQKQFGAGIRALTEAGAKLRVTGCEEHGIIPEDGENYQTRIDEVMFRALRGGSVDEVSRALSLGADVNAVESYVSPGYCALHLAISRCDVAKVQLLLDNGADVRVTSGRGETSLDMLWWAGPKELLGDDWHKIFKALEDKGARTLFSRHPSELTLEDLRRTVPIGLDGETNALHFLVRMNKTDFVMDVINRDPGGLTADDLMKRSGFYKNETLLEAFTAGKRLGDVFTAAVWQGRLEEMMSMRPIVDQNHLARAQVDFEQAKSDILRHRQKDLRDKASAKPGLKLKPPQKPKKPDAP